MRYVYLFLLASLLFCACKKQQPQSLVSQIKDVAIYKPSPDSLSIYLMLADTANKPVAVTGSYLFMLADSTLVPAPIYSDRGTVQKTDFAPSYPGMPKNAEKTLAAQIGRFSGQDLRNWAADHGLQERSLTGKLEIRVSFLPATGNPQIDTVFLFKRVKVDLN
ncbi:hypothetical protein GO755_13015 [Spirosoma sp. HMF4905]|uniref:Uncharacterized protein n=1 Tax=Spirosoma arboris TaxID=2682092 RepID=A0A7K1SBL6_9BACT|nr:hypothetical protein [Spirosoma arboris]MVM30956.1 hypothetical protein [Spirosoma arboris]